MLYVACTTCYNTLSLFVSTLIVGVVTGLYVFTVDLFGNRFRRTLVLLFWELLFCFSLFFLHVLGV